MMEIWVLLAYIKMADTAGVITHEFNGKAACEHAAREIKKSYDDAAAKMRIMDMSGAYVWCVPKDAA